MIITSTYLQGRTFKILTQYCDIGKQLFLYFFINEILPVLCTENNVDVVFY